MNLFDNDRVSGASQLIATEIMTQIDRHNFRSPLSQRLQKDCGYDELTNIEHVAAMLRALCMAQLKILDDLQSLTSGEDDE
jgi:hypothetical protein